MTTQFEIWLNKLNKELEKEYISQFGNPNPNSYWTNLTYTKGRKFVKIVGNGKVWGFVSMVDGTHMGEPIKKGDLLMAATWSKPAKHSRGNIFDGTARYELWGPKYL